ncbi:hypothetical protein CMI37_36825 [Candidatus Pacearchaeota archaeon]|nr:hypothetical protein [Candidatus Pacearchaeota archaeon]|tara:strand:- start:5776 stop:6174 length:399 start_codon:yes stop_codon:yes gene_type:complete
MTAREAYTAIHGGTWNRREERSLQDLYDVIAVLVAAPGQIAGTTRITDSDSPYTVLSTDEQIFCDTDGGAITANLPAGVDGTYYRIINVGTSGNDVTVTPDGSELLVGANSSEALYDLETLLLVYETTEGWY